MVSYSDIDIDNDGRCCRYDEYDDEEIQTSVEKYIEEAEKRERQLSYL